MFKLRWKRWLYLTHRWIGIALCLLFAAWFASGVVMMYVGFPELNRTERFAGLPALNFSSATLTPASAVAYLREADFSVIGAPDKNLRRDIPTPDSQINAVSSMQLGMLFGRPVYRVDIGGAAQPRIIFADNGEILCDVSAALALKAIAEFIVQSGETSSTLRYIAIEQTDQWTLSGAMNAHRPLHRIALDDAEGREFYVSSSTGEVVRDTSRKERLLNYIGAVTHWIYPTIIRRHPNLWTWIVDIVATFGTALALSGLWIGVLRWNRNPRSGKSAIPYRGIMRWHYFTGAIFGIFTLSWVFSGLLSMNPGNFNPPQNPSSTERNVTTGVNEDLRLADFDKPLPNFDKNIVEIELLHYDGNPFFLASRRDGTRQLLAIDNGALAFTDRQRLIALAPELMPQAHLQEIQLIERYDNYYYSRHPEHGDNPLPILRVIFADEEATWFHIDMVSGRVTERSNSTNRLYRWLFNGLHSWDILWLWEKRPLWDFAMIIFLSGGLLLSVLGAIVGYRRLVRR